MANNQRFTDAIISEPAPRTPEERERFRGRDAYRMSKPRDPNQSAAWLQGYDELAAKWDASSPNR